jgi:hypothetical protein
MTSQRYPSGRIINTEFDSTGRVSGVKDAATNNYYVGGMPTDSANRIQYNSQGAVSAMKLGNGLWERTTYNSRLQPTYIKLGS